MENSPAVETNKSKTLLFILMAVTLIASVLFWVLVQGLQLQGLPLYFTQLGLYLVFFLLAGWGIKQERISLPISKRSIAAALAWTLVGWGVFVLLIQALGLAKLPDEFQALRQIPAWKVLLQILSTWFFVGMGEELLFRGYFLKAFQQQLTRGKVTTAVLLSSAFFALWHLPARIVDLFSGGLDWPTLLLSLLVLFVLGLGFSFLFLRSGNLLLTGLVHGLMDYPLVGKDTQLSFIILLAAIVCVEISRRVINRRSQSPSGSSE